MITGGIRTAGLFTMVLLLGAVLGGAPAAFATHEGEAGSGPYGCGAGYDSNCEPCDPMYDIGCPPSEGDEAYYPELEQVIANQEEMFFLLENHGKKLSWLYKTDSEILAASEKLKKDHEELKAENEALKEELSLVKSKLKSIEAKLDLLLTQGSAGAASYDLAVTKVVAHDGSGWKPPVAGQLLFLNVWYENQGDVAFPEDGKLTILLRSSEGEDWEFTTGYKTGGISPGQEKGMTLFPPPNSVPSWFKGGENEVQVIVKDEAGLEKNTENNAWSGVVEVLPGADG